MAAASSSSNNTSDSNSPVTYYHVFLSFRGEDTRYGFTDHLHTALEAAGFHTFRDKEDLNRGENISPGLENGIQSSRCSVIVFSKTYTSSQWCLDELVMILELKKTSNHVVLPVFYDVDPSELRKQTGKSAEAFARHEERFEAEIGKVDRWRAALKEAANLSGLNLQDEADRHEAKFIEKIVNEVKNKLMSTTVSVTPYLIGRDSQLAEINLWLNDGSLDVGILLICGIPGIGKTTIAKSVYRSNRSRFRGGGFLDNISEISRKPNGLVNIQSELLSQLTRGNREMIIHNVIQGTNRIREVVGSKKLILVLDDVDQRNQLDAVIGMRDWFYRGSKIIITTSKEGAQLVSAHEVSKVHVVKPLRKDESLELFSCYAFRQNLPIDERYKKLSTEIVNHCEGHPLALRVLGSSLSWKSITYWEKAIANLKSTPNGEILTKLKISYNTLGDDHVQNLFLDIACFFIGENIDFVVTVLDECDYRIKNGIQDLQDRYLITIDEHNHVRMHNLLRDMGREIIRQESPKEPGERSRLWNDNESYNVLTEKTGKQAMEGIVLHRQNILNEQVILNTEAFAKMRRLRLLILSEVELKGNYKSFPTRLRWLCWYRFPLKYIHNDFLLESLVVLQMLDSNLIQVWKVPKFLPLLKILDLSGSQYLSETPDFSLVPELEKLILSNCGSLVNIHESIVSLEKLVYLNMSICRNIENLPNICSLKLLETLLISGCSNLNNFSLWEIGKMKSLKLLCADGTPMNGQIKSLASSNPLPQFLVEMSLINCNLSDEDFCSLGFSDLSLLRRLNLSKNQISRLPDFIRSLNGLDRLCFGGCTKLKSVERLPDIKVDLDLSGCNSLEKVTFQSDSCKPVKMMYRNTNLVEFGNWFKVYPIGSIDAEMIDILGLEKYLEFMRDITINISSPFSPPKKNVPIEGIQEYGIFNIFLPGNEIPGLYSHKSRHSTISITWPPLPIKNFQGLNIAIVYAVDHKYHNSMMIQVHNLSKGLKWIYDPTFFGYQDDGKDMIWLSHWKFGNHELEGGDEVSVSIFLHYTDDFIKINFKEFGVHIVYDQEEKMSNQDNKADTSNRGGIIYENQRYYEVMPGTYFINNDMPSDHYVFPSERWVHIAMRHLRKISDIDVAKSKFKSNSKNKVQVARSPSPQNFEAPSYARDASANPRICSGKRKRAIIHKLPYKRSKLLCSSSGDTSSSQRITRDEVLIELGLDINASPSSEENLSEDLSGNEASDQEYFSDSHGLYDLEGLSSSNEDLYVSDCKEDETRGRDDVGLATDDGEVGCNTVNGFDVDKDVAKLNIKDDHAAVGDDLFSHKDTKDLFCDYLTKMHISQDVPLDDVVPPGWLTMNSRFPYPPAGNFGISIPKSPTSNFGNIQKVSSTPSRDAMVNRGSPIDATTTSCSVAPDLSESPHPLQFSGLTEVVVADPILSDGPTVPLFNTFEGTRRTSGKFDQVYGFSVLKADVGLYKAIVDHTRQHIATREVIKTDSALITIVGNVLDIVRGMAKVTARTVSLAQLKDWASGLEDAEALRFHVGWVRERFDALVHNSKLQRNGGATINAREAEIRNAEVLVTQLKAAIERSKGELTSMENRLQVEEIALTQSREALSKAHCEKEQVEALLSEPSLGTSWGNILSDVI